MRWKGPLSDSYPAAAAMVVCSLVPYLALTAAVLAMTKRLEAGLGLSEATLDLTVAMSTAAYAFGTVLAVQFAVKMPARRMLVVYETLFVVASILAAAAPDGQVFIAAFVVQGLCTSLMLIAAVPPLVTAWPPRKMPVTGTIMNLCIFGAVAVGPTLGAFQASAHGWRPLFWGVAAIAVCALAMSLLTYEDQPPQDPEAPWDLSAVGLAAVGCGAAFWGAGQLQAYKAVSVMALALLCGGMALVVVLVVSQYAKKRPLMPMKLMASTIPVTGVCVALAASAASFGLMELVVGGLARSTSISTVGWLFLPEFAAAVLTAGLFGFLFRTRWVPVLALSGLAVVVGAGALLAGVVTSASPLVAAGSGMVGLGVGASVSPALFMAGFSLKSNQLQRVFAMVELLRGVTAFLVAPILVFLAGAISPSMQTGMAGAVWICLGIAAVGAVGCTILFVTGQRRLQTPDIDRWQEEGEPAWTSAPLLARWRAAVGDSPGIGDRPLPTGPGRTRPTARQLPAEVVHSRGGPPGPD